MAGDSIRLIRAIPHARAYAPLLDELGSKGGLVTAFSDGMLPVLYAMLPEDDGTVEVRSFGQVVGSVLSMAGHFEGNLAQRGLVVAAVEAACAELPEDSPFAGVRAFGGFHRRMEGVLDELRAHGIGAVELERAAEAVGPALGQRLRGMGKIEREVRGSLISLGRVLLSDHMEACRGVDLSHVTLPRVLVFAGASFEQAKLEWLRWLATQGADVTVVVDRSAAAELFEGAEKTVGFLGLAAQDLGETNRLTESLFLGSLSTSPCPDVRVVSAADPLSEAEWALREAAREIRDGRSPGSIGVYARSLSDYAGLLEAAASRHGVPLRMVRRIPLVTNGFVRLVLQCLEFCGSSDVRTLGALSRNTYARVSRDVQKELDSALGDAYARRQGQWEALTEWARANVSRVPWILPLLEWRQEAMAESASLAVWKSRLDDLIDRLDWLSTSLEGPAHLRSRDVRARNAFQRVLAQRGSVQQLREAGRLSLAAFASECRRLWTEEDVSVPSHEFGVVVVSSAVALPPVESLYVLGMLEGVFPRRRSENPILPDEDRLALAQALPDLPRLTTSHETAREERDEFYRLCAAPTQRLTFSYPLTNDEQDNVPAFYLAEIERISQGARVDRPRAELVPQDAPLRTEADERMLLALSEPKESPVQNVLRSVEANLATRVSEQGLFTPTELREVLECPFRHMSRYRLKLESGRERSRWAALRRLPQLTRLPLAKTMDEARRALELALDTELEAHFAEASAFDLSMMRSGGRRLIEEWVAREFQARALWPKEPESTRANVAFGDSALAAQLPIGEHKVTLSGVAAAHSRMGSYNVLSLAERRRPRDDEGRREELGELDQFELGLYLWAMYTRERKSALEVDSMRGERTLYLLPRDPECPVPSRQEEGLRVVDLGLPSEFFRGVKRLLKQAIQSAAKPEVRAIPQEHCRWCDYGELCRSSSEFGEDSGLFDHVKADEDL